MRVLIDSYPDIIVNLLEGCSIALNWHGRTSRSMAKDSGAGAHRLIVGPFFSVSTPTLTLHSRHVATPLFVAPAIASPLIISKPLSYLLFSKDLNRLKTSRGHIWSGFHVLDSCLS